MISAVRYWPRKCQTTKDDIAIIVSEFDNVSVKIFSSLFRQFSESIRIDRKKDENVFKMQAAKFFNTPKYWLRK
jgi:hypothetical protein